MSLTVVPPASLPFAFPANPGRPLRRPLSGFPERRLRIVGTDLTATPFAEKPSKASPVGRNRVTDIAAWRMERMGAAPAPRPSATRGPMRGTRWLLASAAAAPPLFWLGYTVLHAL